MSNFQGWAIGTEVDDSLSHPTEAPPIGFSAEWPVSLGFALTKVGPAGPLPVALAFGRPTA